jgi:uncharacterized membrane protein YfcA
MSFIVLVVIGVLVGVTTVLFAFGGGFVTVPIITVADAALGGDAVRVATATSALVMLVNAAVATVSARRGALAPLRSRSPLFVLLGVGGAVGVLAARGVPDALLRWGFVVYLGVTVADLLLRPGFLRDTATDRAVATRGGGRNHGPTRTGVPTATGLPIGAVAAFLGVGGSVMTVPMLRRAGATMTSATTLANPLTLAITLPAAAVTMLLPAAVPHDSGLVGAVDVRAAVALLVGAMPVIVLLRRRPPHLPEVVHAWGYVALLVAAGTVVALG